MIDSLERSTNFSRSKPYWKHRQRMGLQSSSTLWANGRS